jgi:hypothetical protein
MNHAMRHLFKDKLQTRQPLRMKNPQTTSPQTLRPKHCRILNVDHHRILKPRDLYTCISPQPPHNPQTAPPHNPKTAPPKIPKTTESMPQYHRILKPHHHNHYELRISETIPPQTESANHKLHNPQTLPPQLVDS